MADAKSRLEIELILRDKATKALKAFAKNLKKVTGTGTTGVKRLNKALTVTSTGLAVVTGSAASASTGMVVLSRSVMVTSGSMVALGIAAAGAGQALILAPTQGSAGFANLGRIIDITAIKTTKLTFSMRAFGLAALKATSGAIRGFRRMLAPINKASASLLAFGGRLTAVALAVAAVVRGTTGFLKFGTAMAEVNTIFSGTAEELKIAGDRVQDFSRQLGLDQIKVAKGLYQTLSSGITDTADAFLVLETAAKLGVAGVATTRESVDLLTGQINAFGLEVSGPMLKALSDMNFKTVELGKTTIPELSKSMGKAAPLAAQLGIGLVEVNAIIATLTKANIDTTEAFTGLRAILNNLLQPSEDAKVLLQAIGIESGALAVESMGLINVLKLIKVAYEGDTEALTSLFNNVRAATPVLALMGNQAQSLADNIHGIGNAAGSSGQAIDKQLSTPARRLKIIFTGLTQGLEDLVESFLEGFGFLDETLIDAQRNAKSLRDSIAKFTPVFKTMGEGLSLVALGWESIAHAGLEAGAVMGLVDKTSLENGRERLLVNAEIRDSMLSGIQITEDLARRLRRINAKQSEGFDGLTDSHRRASKALGGFSADLRNNVDLDVQGMKRSLGEFDRAVEMLGINQTKAYDAVRLFIKEYEKINGLIIDPQLMVVTPEIVLPTKEELFARGAGAAKTFGDGFKAEMKRFGEALTAEEIGISTAADLFGTLNFAIDDFSRRLVDSELTFKGFAKSLLKDLAAIIIRMQILRALGGLFGGGSTGGGIDLGGGTPGPGGGYSSPDGFAEGGVKSGTMLGHSSLPVKAYAHGGIATTPQLAIFGEGKSAGGEAFVPLGGDQKIPVKFPDGGGGGGGVQATIYLTVSSIDPRGAADVVLAQMPLIEKKLAASIQTGRNRGLTTAIRTTARGGR